MHGPWRGRRDSQSCAAPTGTNETNKRKQPKRPNEVRQSGRGTSPSGEQRHLWNKGLPLAAAAPAPVPAPADPTSPANRLTHSLLNWPHAGSQRRVQEGQQIPSARLGTSQSLILRLKGPERQALDPACHAIQRFSVQFGFSVLAAPTSWPIYIYLSIPLSLLVSKREQKGVRRMGQKEGKKRKKMKESNRDSKCSEIVFGCHQNCGRVPGSPGRVLGVGPGPRGVFQTLIHSLISPKR